MNYFFSSTGQATNLWQTIIDQDIFETLIKCLVSHYNFSSCTSEMFTKSPAHMVNYVSLPNFNCLPIEVNISVLHNSKIIN